MSRFYAIPSINRGKHDFIYLFHLNIMKTQYIFDNTTKKTNVVIYKEYNAILRVFVYALLLRIYSWHRKQGLYWNWIFWIVCGLVFFILNLSLSK